jgi:hypothetical protein
MSRSRARAAAPGGAAGGEAAEAVSVLTLDLRLCALENLGLGDQHQVEPGQRLQAAEALTQDALGPVPATAPPTLRDAAKPSRLYARPFAAATIRNSRPSRRIPWRKAFRNSEPRTIRSAWRSRVPGGAATPGQAPIRLRPF